MKNRIIILIVFLCLSACQRRPDFSNAYLGQTPPGMTAELFAPGIVATGHHEHSSPTFSPDGWEIYWSMVTVPFEDGGPHLIMRMIWVDSGWHGPEIAPFSGVYSEDGPRFSPDGKRLYYYSKRPNEPDGEPKTYADIWVVEKSGDSWSAPMRLDGPINTDALETSPSQTVDGHFYFMRGVNEPEVQYDLYRSEWDGRTFAHPELLDERINSPYHDYTPFIASDESYLLFSSVNRPDGFGSGDLYVSFRMEDGSWSDPQNLGDGVNTPHNERFPSVSPDGKYLFFVSNVRKEENLENLDVPQNGYCDVYWVDAKVIEALRLEQ